MAHIFVSYRRDDTPAAAGRIYDALVSVFGKDRVFKDVDAIGAGEDFQEVIRTNLRHTVVVVAVIGKKWEGPRGFLRRTRLLDDGDWVRVELELARSFRIPVIPLLIDRDTPPSSNSLPSVLQYLSKIQSPQLRHERWGDDMASVIREIQTKYGEELGSFERTTNGPGQPENATAPSPTTADIYVCFRLSDVPNVAQRVVQEMQRQFPDAAIRTSKDVAVGPDVSAQLVGQIKEHTAVLVLIGPNWLSAESPTGERRLEQDGDYVRVAIEEALVNSAPLVPILVDGGIIPRSGDLPHSITVLSRFNAGVLGSEIVDFERGMRNITEWMRIVRMRSTN